MTDQANDVDLAEAAGAVIDGDIFDHDPSKAEKVEVRNKEPLNEYEHSIIEIPLRHPADSEPSVEISTTDTWGLFFCLALRLAERIFREGFHALWIRNFGVCFHGFLTLANMLTFCR